MSAAKPPPPKSGLDIKKVEKKVKGSFGLIDSFVMGMALGSGGKYIRADDVDWEDDTPLLVRGLGKQKLIKMCIERGRDFYFMDTGYVGNNPSTRNPNGKKTYHRIVKNALQNLHMPDREQPGSDKWYGGGRWNSLAIPFKDATPGRKILVVPPSEKVMKYFDQDLDTWIDQTIATIRKNTSRPVQLRKKPSREDRVSVNTMEQALADDVHCLITYNSIAATEALMEGRPAISLGPNAASSICETSLENIENLRIPTKDEMYAFMTHLSYAQFTQPEMIDGTAWKILQGELE